MLTLMSMPIRLQFQTHRTIVQLLTSSNYHSHLHPRLYKTDNPTKSSPCNIDHVPVVKPKMKPVDPLRLSSYGLGHTDGGRRDVVLKSKGSGAKTLKDVGGWAFQILCSRGEKYVGSASLGPGSTNNIGEY